MRLLPLLAVLCCGCPAGVGADLVINEFVASNASGVVDETGAFPDWIELLNVSSGTLNLGEFYISDDPIDPGKHRFSGDLNIEAGAYLVVYADGDAVDGSLHLPFKLSSMGEDILVHRIIDDEPVLRDSVTFGAQQTDTSSARLPDGTGDFVDGSTPTPGASND